MANLFQLDTVKYICSCGSLKPICFIYFCRHCLRLRCPYCVSHEVDSHYCGNCSENMPSAEAKQKKNRCGSCYCCPCCRQTLTIKAISTHVPSEEDSQKTVVKKVYYLACNFCRWTSRDAGLPDGGSTLGPWAEPECPVEKQVNEISSYFRNLSLREKNSKERKFVHKSKFLAAGRHGLAHLLPKRYPVSSPEEMSKEIPPPNFIAEAKKLDELELQLQLTKEASKEDEALKEESEQVRRDQFFEADFNIAKVTTLEQRLYQMETQPTDTSSLLPTHKQLLIKRSLRCRVCERNISKPEYSPVSIKFKIQLNAYYHVPQIRMMAPLTEPLIEGKKIRIVFRIANPTQFPTVIKFLPFSHVPLTKEEASSLTSKALTENPIIPDESSTDQSLKSQLAREVHVLPIRNEEFNINCRIVPPETEIILPPRDETSDFDDFADTPDFNDDSKFVPWRKANKAAIYLEIIPDKTIEEGETPLLGLTIEYDYVNTIVALESKASPQKVRLQAHLLVDLSKTNQ